MLRWFKVGQRWHATWRVATLNQLEITSLNGQIQQGKWQFTLTLQVAHLLAMVHVVLFKSCTCNYAFIYFLHLQTCMHFISYLHFLTLRKFTGERYRNITTHLRWHVWKQTSKQSRCSTTRRCCESHGCRPEGGGGTRGVSGWFGFWQTTQNPVCWDFRGVKSPFKVQRGCHWRTVWVQNGINYKSVLFPFTYRSLFFPLFVTDW